MKHLGKYIKPYLWLITLTVLIKLGAAILELMLPYLMEQMLDVYVPVGNARGLYLCGIGMFLCAVGCLITNILANRMSAYSSGKITQAVRHDLFKKLQSLSACQLDGLTVSSAESRLTSDTYNVNQFLARIQRMGIRVAETDAFDGNFTLDGGVPRYLDGAESARPGLLQRAIPP